MIETFWNETPATNQWIAQDECGIVPDKAVARGRRIDDEDSANKDENGPDFFHQSRKSISRVLTFANVMSILRLVLMAVAAMLVSNAYADGVPKDCSQLVMAIAPDWNATHGQMQLFERANGNWSAVA